MPIPHQGSQSEIEHRTSAGVLRFLGLLGLNEYQPGLCHTPVHSTRPGHGGYLPCFTSLTIGYGHRSGFGSTSTSRRVPMPLQPVPAPSNCEILLGKLQRICAIHVGSVRGVLSSFLGRCCTTSISLGQIGTHDDAPCSLGRMALPTHLIHG